MAALIARISFELNIPGNQSKSYRLDHVQENISPDHFIWASDFLTFNPDCPLPVKEWLTNNFKARFNKQSNS
jgi:hypothetical protein